MAKRTDDKGRALKPGESQRENLTYMYRYTDQFKKRKTIYAKTLTELRQKEKEVAAREVVGYYNDASKITVSELMQLHNNAKAERRKSTQKNYDHRKAFVERFPMAKCKASSIKTSQAREWLIKLHKEEGFSVRTVYAIGRYLKEAYKIAIEDELLFRNPFDFKLDMFSEELPSRKAITMEELLAFLDFVKGEEHYQPFYHYLVVLSETGMRLSEFLGLTELDIDFGEKTVSVNHQLRVHKNNSDFYIERPKTSKGVRNIPLTEKAIKSLRYICKRAKEQPLRPIVEGVTGFVVVRDGGLLYADSTFDKCIATIRKKYKAASGSEAIITPHVLRHTFCTLLIEKGVPVSIMQYLMGHARSATTLDVYTHVSASVAAKGLRDVFDNGNGFSSTYTSELTPQLTPKLAQDA